MGFKDRESALLYYKEYNLKRRTRRVKQARQIALEANETHYFTGNPCKHGHIAKRRVNDRVCMECDNVIKKQYLIDNPEKVAEQKRNGYIKNKAKYLKQKQQYRQENKGKINALVAKRKSYIKQATPAWVGKEELWLITEIYELAALRTKLFGFGWHVDHIIPLQGKLVSGLHVPENMRVIPAIENIKKKNKFEVHNGF